MNVKTMLGYVGLGVVVGTSVLVYTIEVNPDRIWIVLPLYLILIGLCFYLCKSGLNKLGLVEKKPTYRPRGIRLPPQIETGHPTAVRRGKRSRPRSPIAKANK